MAASEAELFKKNNSQTAVQLAELLMGEASRCEDAFPEQLARSILVEGLPLNVRDSMQMYYATRLL